VQGTVCAAYNTAGCARGCGGRPWVIGGPGPRAVSHESGLPATLLFSLAAIGLRAMFILLEALAQERCCLVIRRAGPEGVRLRPAKVLAVRGPAAGFWAEICGMVERVLTAEPPGKRAHSDNRPFILRCQRDGQSPVPTQGHLVCTD